MRILLALILLASVSYSQSFEQYETEKKEKATAYMLSIALPGAGVSYATGGQEVAFYSMLEAVLLYWAIEADAKVLPVALLSGMKVMEFLHVSAEIDKYNKQLRLNLKLTL